MIKIAYFGTWDFSKNILKDLLENKEIKIEIVISQEDKKVWRKQELQETPVKVLAKENSINVLQPKKLKDNLFLFEELRSLNLDFIIVVAYWKIIPKEILEIPKFYPINIHWSILPSYRWASPIQESLKNWDTKTWLTIMQMSEWMDEWDIFKIQNINIDIKDKTPDIFKKFESFGAELLFSTLKEIIDVNLVWTKQNELIASYCSKIEKLDWEVNFKKESSKDIYNKFRAYTPWPWIYTEYKWKKLSIEDCFYSEEAHKWEIWDLIKLENWDIWIICKDWILVLYRIKLEWKKDLSIKDFINWNKDFLEYKFN